MQTGHADIHLDPEKGFPGPGSMSLEKFGSLNIFPSSSSGGPGLAITMLKETGRFSVSLDTGGGH